MAPYMVSNQIDLKMRIIDKAQQFSIIGDIELDQGYSFAYQITIYFPTYFQKQTIKAQFSVYDPFVWEGLDPNAVQRRNLSQMAKIDTNIFRDLNMSKQNLPTEESLAYDPSFNSLKVVRLKPSEQWMAYICLEPKICEISKK